MSPATSYWTRRLSRNSAVRDNEILRRCSRVLRSKEAAPPEQRAKDVRILLQQLGPLYASFALYLSSRIDLLPAEYCRELVLSADSVPPLPAATVEHLLADELGPGVDAIFNELHPAPLRSTLISQSHLATLKNGNTVVLILLRPEYYSLQSEQGVLDSFDSAFLRSCCPEVAAEGTLCDFFDSLRRKTNFLLQAEAIESMSQDAASFDLLGACRVHLEFCTRRLMVMDHCEDRSLDRFLRSFPHHAELLALRLCQVWLQQAFFGKSYAVDAMDSNVSVRGNRQICFRECDFAALPKRTKENLWNYLIATATDDPDKAASYLLTEMSRTHHARVDPEAFRSSFRQAASFGELEPVLGTNSNSLSQLVFQHWKTALEHGYRPHPHLLSLYRGLFSLARIARQIVPARDSLREGLEELRSSRTLRQLTDLAEWGTVLRDSEKFATVFAQLPKALDDALNKASSASQEGLVLGLPKRAQPRTGSPFGNVVVNFLLAMTVFLSQPSLGVSRWAIKLAALSLMLAGLLVLRGIAD